VSVTPASSVAIALRQAALGHTLAVLGADLRADLGLRQRGDK